MLTEYLLLDLSLRRALQNKVTDINERFVKKLKKVVILKSGFVQRFKYRGYG